MFGMMGCRPGYMMLDGMQCRMGCSWDKVDLTCWDAGQDDRNMGDRTGCVRLGWDAWQDVFDRMGCMT